MCPDQGGTISSEIMDLLDQHPDGFDLKVVLKPRRPLRLVWTIGHPEPRLPGDVGVPGQTGDPETEKVDFRMQMLDSEKVRLSVSGQDSQGNPVAVPGTLAWSVVNPPEGDVVTLSDNGDGSFEAISTGALGTAAVTVNDDVDGDGNPEFQGSISIEVLAGPVTAIVVEAGAPEPR